MSEKEIPARPLPEAEAALIARVDEHKDELVALLKELVAIDSRVVNLETFSDQSRIIAFVEAFMKGAGASCEQYHCPHPHAPAASGQSWPSLIAGIGARGGKRLQFCGHLDVVPFTAEGWATDPLVAVEKDGKLFGRGTADMKGGVACQMMAFKILAGAGIPLKGRLQMLFLPDEEMNGEYGSQFMVREHKAAIDSPTIISEPTGQPPIKSPAIIVGEKGHAWLKLKFLGASGHGSMPKQRSNSINKATRFVEQRSNLRLPSAKPPLSLANMLRSLLGRFSLGSLLRIARAPPAEAPDPYDKDGIGVGNFFKSTISFNQIHAGTKVNVIPSTCVMEVDIRVLPGITLQQVIDSIVDYCTDLGYVIRLPEGFRNLQREAWKERWEAFLLEHPFDVELSVISSTPGTFEDPGRPFTQLLSDAFEDVYHVKSVHFFAPGSSDAVFLRGGGISDVVLFGPTGGHTHDANEFVDIGDLVKMTKVFLLVAYRMLCKPI
ncbi:MAG: M20 family metallopeptidase [Candidatus Lokiarchaeota archaeon]|nr:M20 family metallopeptidase [Candidatus Lokiarchaeota archaeon]